MRVPEAGGQSSAWQERPEAGGRVATRLMRVLAFGLGRPLARFLTFFAALYFMIRRGPERAASRAYLERASWGVARAGSTSTGTFCVSRP